MKTVPGQRGVRVEAALHAAMSAWLAWRAFVAGAGMEFLPGDPGSGVRTFVADIGYPKQQDFVWWFGGLAAGLLGSWMGGIAIRMIRRSGWPARFTGDVRTWPAGCGALVLAGVLELSRRWAAHPVTIVILCAGAVLPWLDRRWYLVPEGPQAPACSGSMRPGPWLAGAVAIALALAVDPSMGYRPIDGVHEGLHLAYVQHALHGERPGVEFTAEYGSLYLGSVAVWMRIFGGTLLTERHYFAVAQALATIVGLACLLVCSRSLPGRLAGAWLFLTTTTSVQIYYGWGNGLRSVLPLAAVVAAGVARRSLGMLCAGAATAVAWWYSPEFGAAGALAALSVLACRTSSSWPLRSWWGAGFILGLTGAGGIMFGSDLTTGLLQPAGGGFIRAKFAGAMALPFPPFFGWDQPEAWGAFWDSNACLLAIWFPVLLAGVTAGGWLARDRVRSAEDWAIVAGLAVFGLASQIPGLVRPTDQIRMAATGVAIWAAVLIERIAPLVPRQRRRGWAGITITLLAIHGTASVIPYLTAHVTKWRLPPDAVTRTLSAIPGIGGVRLATPERERLERLVARLRQLSPAGRRVYMGAPHASELLFFADRLGVIPYPMPGVAQTDAQRQEGLAALREADVAVALIGREWPDLGFERMHPEDWEWIRRNFRKEDHIQGVEFWVRLSSRSHPAPSNRSF